MPILDDGYNFRPRPLGDRQYHSYRQGKDERHTQVAVDLEGGVLAEAMASTEEQMLFYLKAIAGGISMMTETSIEDLVNMADT